MVPGTSAKHRTALPIRLVVVSLPGYEQQAAEAQQFGHTQLLPVNLGGEQGADQVVPGPASALFDQVQEVLGHFPLVAWWSAFSAPARVWLTMTSDHCLKRSRSAGGMPMSSAITITGSGYANSRDQVRCSSGSDPVQQFVREL